MQQMIDATFFDADEPQGDEREEEERREDEQQGAEGEEEKVTELQRGA